MDCGICGPPPRRSHATGLKSIMDNADLNRDRLALALEAAGLDLWENDLITGEVTLNAT